MSILANSTPAAPRTIYGAAGEFAQDVRFGFFSFDSASAFPQWIAGLFLSGRNATQSNRINSIEIFPGSITIKEGEQAIFSGVAYDLNNDELDGIGFTWQVSDSENRFAPHGFADGKFESWLPGTFTVKAESGGYQTEVTVIVTPSETESQNRPAKSKTAPIEISSRSGKRTGQSQTDATDEENKETGKTSTSSPLTDESDLPDPSGWNNGNWQSGGDPGNQIGNPPGHPADDGAGSGNFQLSAPVVSLPGRGIDLALNLNYNSRLWNKSGSELTYDIDRGYPGPGWSLGFGKIMDMGSAGGSMIVDADGTRHGYSGTISYGTHFNGHTTDGKFIDYTSYRDSNGIASANVQMPNGTVISYGARGNGAVYPVIIQDANGNFIKITYRGNAGPNIDTVTDTLGRIITFKYDTLGRLISVEAPRFRTDSRSPKRRTVVQFHYRQLQLNHAFNTGVSPVVRDNAPWVVDAIYYPATQTGYWFGDTDSYSTYGMLAKVVEQRGMNWQASAEEQGTVIAGQMTKQAVYNYPLTTANETGRTSGSNLSDAPTYEILAESWDGMDEGPAITTYNVQQNTNPRTTTVVQPNGSVSRQLSYNAPNLFNDGLVYQDETYVPDPNGITVPNVTGTFKLIGKSNVTWESGHYQAPRPLTAEITDENNQKVSTQYTYAVGPFFNQITRSCDYNNDNILLRCAVAQYENAPAYIGQFDSGGRFQSGRHIFNLVKATGVENPNQTRASWTEYEYDNYQSQPFVDAPGVIQHAASHNPFDTGTYRCNCRLECDTSLGETLCQGGVPIEVCDTCQIYDPGTDVRGNITKVTSYSDAQNLTGAITETKSYDITGNLVAASTSCCQQTSFQYSTGTQYAYPESQTRGSADPNSPDRVTTSAIYDYQTGLVKQMTDANGRVSSMQYNADTLRPIKSISSTGAYTNYTYNETAMTVTAETFEASGTLANKNVSYLNGLGQVKKEEAPGANNVLDIAETKYNKLGQVWKQSRPYRAGDTVHWSETIYDAQGRTIKVIEPDGSFSEAAYNETQRPDSASNLAGNTTRVVDAWGRERWGRYDQQGRLAEVVEPKPNGNGSVLAAGSLVTKYNYDTVGRLVETEQGDQHRYFKYDSLGRLTRQKLAEQTATLNDAGVYVGAGQTGAAWSEAFQYDNRSNVTQKTDARGAKSNYVYTNLTTGAEDALNRIQAVTYDLSGPRDPNLPIYAAYNVTYEYMPTGDKSRIKKVTTAGLEIQDYAYDPEGRVQDYTQTIVGRENYPMTTSYLYDTLDRITDVRYPAQYGLAGSPRKLVQHTYDIASRLTTLKVDGQQQAGDIVYNAADQTTSINIGVAGANQVNENYTFDSQTGLLTNQKAIKNNQNLLDLSYEYNRNNSVGTLNGKTGHLSKIINNLDNNKNRDYEYDALGRLTKAKGGTNNLWTQNYSYDRYGNRTNVTATGVAADNSSIPRDGIPNLSYNSTTNRITTQGFEYDVAGNQTRALAEDGQTWLRFEYDAANRLRVVKRDDGTGVQAFEYGATNARVASWDYQTSQLTIYAGSGGAVLSEYTEFAANIPTWTKSFTYLGDSALSTITPNGQGGEYTEFNHPDRLGTRVITNQQSGTSYEQAALPFGTALNGESTVSTNKKRFTSYDRSERTGLDYAVNRTYDWKQGRFTQVDPIKMSAVSLTSPQTLNLYTYCGNDPINHTDSDGLFFGSLFKWIGKAINAIKRAVAAIIAVVLVIASIINIGNPAVSSATIKGALFMAAGLFAYAFGSSKVQAIIGIVAAISTRQIGIIVNFSETNKIPLWQKLLGAISTLGAISNLGQTKNQPKKKNSPPCPETGQQIANTPGLQEVWKLAQDVSKIGGRFTEVGGWILAKKGVEKYTWVIYKDPRNLVDRTFGLNETNTQQKVVGDLLKKGWYIVANFHTHGDNSPMNEYDEALSTAYKTPGIVIQPGGKPVPYGVEKGVWGIGIPKGCK